jgi:type IV secretory pathway VirB2 component (pilin)
LRTRSCIALAALILVLPLVPAHAAATGGSLPWDTPLQTLSNDIKGPVAFTISLLGLVATGAALLFGGEINEFIRRIIMVVLCRVIRESGHRCHCVGTKTDALQLLAPGSHALVIADVLLPDGRGHDVAERAEQLGIRAITMSGHPDEIQGFAGAARIHLVKPFGMQEFEQVLGDNVSPPD